MTSVRALPILTLVLLAGCASAPPSAPKASFDAAAAVAAVRAAGRADGGELDVQPLRDPQVEDLRQQAAAREAAGDAQAAVALLDRALSINPDDPALLQERAEAALLALAHADAERFARAALAKGSTVGPLCRRHWETVAQAQLARRSAAQQASVDTAVSEARRQRDACTVAPPPRY
ncbi:MAG TPA: tetratricopeptide repeat protein [Lysobacter sp.]|nr:tetratricopeptide repeat protein [Lysobacter sp.]